MVVLPVGGCRPKTSIARTRKRWLAGVRVTPPQEVKSCLLVSYVHISRNQFLSSTLVVMFHFLPTLCSGLDVQQVQGPGRQHHP